MTVKQRLKQVARLGGIGLVLWGIAALVILGVGAYSLSDFRGGLPQVDYGHRLSCSSDGVERLRIEAEGLPIEIAMGYDAKEITAGLYGPAYTAQVVTLGVTDGEALVTFPQGQANPNRLGQDQQAPLTLRIVLPKRVYHRLTVASDVLDLRLHQCRFATADIRQAGGRIDLDGCQIATANITTDHATIIGRDNRFSQLEVIAPRGDVRLADNTYRSLHIEKAYDGDVLLVEKNLAGVRQVMTAHGDVHIISKKLPRRLTLDLAAYWGNIEVNFAKKEWKKLSSDRTAAAGQVVAQAGDGRDVLQVHADYGNICLQIQERRTIIPDI